MVIKSLKLVTLASVVFLGVPLSDAHATPQKSTEDRAKLAARVDAANRLYQKQEYTEALTIYQEIYQQTQEPSMLFSIGQCYRNLGQLQKASDAYHDFLLEAPTESEFRPIAEQLLREIEPQLTPKKSKRALVLYGGAAATGATSITFGAIALKTILEAGARQDAGDFQGALDQLQQADKRALAADLFGVASFGLAIGGFVLSKKDKKSTTSLSLSTNKLTLAVEF